MKKVLLFVSVLAVLSIYACSKESMLSTAAVSDLGYVTDRDSSTGNPHHGGHHGHHGHLGDSLHFHILDSLGHHHGLDSLGHHHGCDSLHHHHDSLGHHHHDSLHTHVDTTFHPGGHHGGPFHGPNNGPNHGNQDTLNQGGVHIQPVTILVTDLPQAAQDWLTANKPGATIQKVLKTTKPDGTVVFVVKIKNGGTVRFDANGNKIG
jgi:hypothetical protein